VIASSHWGVLVAQRQKAAAVGKALNDKAVDNFIPLLETQQVVHGKRVLGTTPLLGDYILISVGSIWRSLLAIRGVSGILLNDLGFPAQVLPSEIEYLRALCVNGVYSPRAIKKRGFEFGDKVTPREGPLAFHVGKYDKGGKRSDSAFFLIFGREQRVVFKAGELIAA